MDNIQKEINRAVEKLGIEEKDFRVIQTKTNFIEFQYLGGEESIKGGWYKLGELLADTIDNEQARNEVLLKHRGNIFSLFLELKKLEGIQFCVGYSPELNVLAIKTL